MIDKKFKIADKSFKSRLIVGTGKYKSFKECAKAIKHSLSELFSYSADGYDIV